MDEAAEVLEQVAEHLEVVVEPIPGGALIVLAARIAVIVLVAALVWIVVHGLMKRWVRVLLTADPGRPVPEEELQRRVDTLSHAVLRAFEVAMIVVVAIMILGQLDIEIAPLIAGAGVVGIAIGFGAQSLVRDYFAGTFILLENQYAVGDVVRVADVAGLVEDINLRRTVLRDLDGTVHFVPNGEVRVASNFTKSWARVNLDVTVAYGEDVDQVCLVLNRIGQELADDPEWTGRILEAPQVLRVEKFQDSGVAIKVLGVVKAGEQWAATGELRRRIKRTFDDVGIEIPFPYRTLVHRNLPFGEGQQERPGNS